MSIYYSSFLAHIVPFRPEAQSHFQPVPPQLSRFFTLNIASLLKKGLQGMEAWKLTVAPMIRAEPALGWVVDLPDAAERAEFPEVMPCDTGEHMISIFPKQWKLTTQRSSSSKIRSRPVGNLCFHAYIYYTLHGSVLRRLRAKSCTIQPDQRFRIWHMH